MLVEKFKADKDVKLSKLIESKIPSLSYGSLNKIFRNKDVIVDGVRCSSDRFVTAGSEVKVFYQEPFNIENSIVYDDENIVIVNKPRGVETINENGENEKSLFDYVKSLSKKCFAVHRLDRNTSGLVVFAKNVKAKESLDSAFKNRTIDKYYLTLVYGFMKSSQNTEQAFLKKDAKKSFVQISAIPLDGYSKILTKYKVLEEYENSSLLEVELLTGKTHQIRAHLSYLGNFVIGDEKYGRHDINKKFNKKYQCLTAYKIIFHFEAGDMLGYLNGKVIELEKSKIDFLSNNK